MQETNFKETHCKGSQLHIGLICKEHLPYLQISIKNVHINLCCFFIQWKGATCCPLNMCCWLLPIESSSLLLPIYLLLALADNKQLPAAAYKNAAGSCQYWDYFCHLGFSKAYSSKHKRAKNLKKLQLSDIICRLFYNI
jgi:hypothetical protein